MDSVEKRLKPTSGYEVAVPVGGHDEVTVSVFGVFEWERRSRSVCKKKKCVARIFEHVVIFLNF